MCGLKEKLHGSLRMRLNEICYHFNDEMEDFFGAELRWRLALFLQQRITEHIKIFLSLSISFITINVIVYQKKVIILLIPNKVHDTFTKYKMI